MHRATLFALAATATLPAAPDTLQVRREADRTLAVSIESEWEFETTSFAMERDGEPVEMPEGRRGGTGSMVERKLERIDRVLESEDGAPTRVRREFVTVEGERMFAEESQQLDSPFEGVVLELTRSDDEVEVEVVEGDEPDGDGALDGHRLELELEALLGEGELEIGDRWDVDGEALGRALGIDLEQALYPRPEREEGQRGEGGGRRRGMRGGGGGGSPATWFDLADWSGTAELVATDDEWEGAECLLVKLECSGSGELPERGGQGGGRRGGSAGAPAPTAVSLNSFEVELRGELWFDPALGLPVRLDVEIEYGDSTRTERDRGGSVMVMESEHSGVLHHVMEVRVEDGGSAEE